MVDKSRVWIEVVRLAIEGARLDLSDMNPELASVVKETMILRLALETVCRRFEVDPKVVLFACSEVVTENPK